MVARTALVTGATGFIGSQLVPALLEQGWTVSACGRRPRPEDLPAGVRYEVVDLAGGEDMNRLLAGVTHVLHLAGASSSLASQDEMMRANAGATQHLVTAAQQSATLERFVYMSSTSIYGEEVALPSPVLETVEPHPSRGYGKTKWASEQVLWTAASEGLPAVILRPVSVFGPYNVKLLASAVLDAAIERFAAQRSGVEPILEVPTPPIEQRLVHIDDLIRATLHLAHHPDAVGHAYNVVVPQYPTSHEVGATIAQRLGMRVELRRDWECGLGYPERSDTRDRMLEAGMRPDILLTKERFRFMRKANLNNRLSVDALLATGFTFGGSDLSGAIDSTIDWYQEHRWIL